MIEMVDNKDIKRATVLVAVITVITYLYYFLDLPGSWALYEFPFILLALWAGMAFSMRVRIPIWVRIVLACICIGMLLGSRYILIGGVMILMGRWGFIKYIVLCLLGLAISPKFNRNNRFWENLILFVIFFLTYIFTELVEQRASSCWYDTGYDRIVLLSSIARYAKLLMLAGSIFYCCRLAFSEKVQCLLSKNDSDKQ